MPDTILTKAANIIAQHSVYSPCSNKILVCALGMVDHDGAPTTSAITAARSGGIQWVTFCTGLASNKVKRLEYSTKASVCFLSEAYNVTLVGTLSVLTDQASKHANWYDALGMHLSGPDDPGYCVLKLTTERYNLFIDWQEVRGTI